MGCASDLFLIGFKKCFIAFLSPIVLESVVFTKYLICTSRIIFLYKFYNSKKLLGLISALVARFHFYQNYVYVTIQSKLKFLSQHFLFKKSCSHQLFVIYLFPLKTTKGSVHLYLANSDNLFVFGSTDAYTFIIERSCLLCEI